MIKYVIKRDGRKKEYNVEFIKQAIKNKYFPIDVFIYLSSSILIKLFFGIILTLFITQASPAI